MIIKWVRLKNIRSYSSEEIYFPEGSILLSGDIGAGKSTILLAIEFALFGFANEINGETLLRNGKSAGSIELLVEIEGKELTIKRNLKKSKDAFSQPSGYIIENGIKTEKSAEELKAYILEKLGYPQEFLKKKNISLYRYTVYTPQEEMKRILFESREERLNSLRKIFNIEKYGTIRANSAIISSALKERIREFSSKSEELAAKREEHSALKKECTGIIKSMEALKPSIESLNKRIAQLKSEKEELEAGIKALSELKRQLASKDATLSEKAAQAESIKKNIAKLTEDAERTAKKEQEILAAEKIDEKAIEAAIERNEREVKALESMIAKASEREKMLSQRKKEIEIDSAREGELRKERDEKEKGIKLLLSECSIKHGLEEKRFIQESRAKAIISEKSRIMFKENDSERIISDIKAKDSCPLCKQPITEDYKEHLKKEHAKIAEDAKRAYLGLEGKEKENESEIKKSAAELNSISEKEGMTEKLKAEFASIDRMILDISKRKESWKSIEENQAIDILETEKKLSEKKKALETEKKRLKDAAENNFKIREKEALKAQLSTDLARLKALQDSLAETKKAVGNVNREKMAITAKIAEMGSPEERYENANALFEEARSKEKEQQINFSTLEKEITLKQQMTAMLEKELLEKEDAKKKFEHAKELFSFVSGKFTELVTLMEKHVMCSVHNEFNNLFEQWFNAIIEEETMSARLDDDFTPVINQDGHDTLTENLSGGEKTAVALAYRLALNRVINDMVTSVKTRDIIILDEPTDGFSSEQLDRVKTVLEELNLRQMIIVSHEAKIESFVSHIIRIAKHEHESKVLA